MIDLHCHILPGCDDGAHTMADALAMAQVAVDNGISHILVTPHHMDGKYTNHKADVIQRTAEFQTALDEAKIDLVVFPGQEVHITGDLMQAIKNDDVLFADETNRYLMLELPHSEVPEYTNQMIFELQAAGITPVIVHPERNHGIQKKHELLYDFVASGCLTQITASSYLGVFGDEVADFTQRIIDAGLGFVFASDAHNLRGRNFRMQKAFAKLEKHNGTEMVTWMQDNAKKIINGDDLEPSEYHHIKEKKKFWLFR